jgi:hypothetical protein
MKGKKVCVSKMGNNNNPGMKAKSVPVEYD